MTILEYLNETNLMAPIEALSLAVSTAQGGYVALSLHHGEAAAHLTDVTLRLDTTTDPPKMAGWGTVTIGRVVVTVHASRAATPADVQRVVAGLVPAAPAVPRPVPPASARSWEAAREAWDHVHVFSRRPAIGDVLACIDRRDPAATHAAIDALEKTTRDAGLWTYKYERATTAVTYPLTDLARRIEALRAVTPLPEQSMCDSTAGQALTEVQS